MNIPMYPPNATSSTEPVLAHPSQVDSMKNNGWTLEKPAKSKPKPKPKEVKNG